MFRNNCTREGGSIYITSSDHFTIPMISTVVFNKMTSIFNSYAGYGGFASINSAKVSVEFKECSLRVLKAT